MKRWRTICLALCLIVLPQLIALAMPGLPRRVPAIKPQIPTADRTAGNRVFLEHADVLFKQEADSYMILSGNVEFTKGPMIMRCDSAHYVPATESMDAFGRVSMQQGDTLFVFADELNYDGSAEIAYLYGSNGRPVRMINRDVELQTPEFIYDLRIELGYYEAGGVLTDPQNRLTSLQGEYEPSTKEANFYLDVHLWSHSDTDTLDIYTDTLYYNTTSRVAMLTAPSEVINSRGTIFTDNGIYDTAADTAVLYDRSLLVTAEGRTLTADTLRYDNTAGVGIALGNALMTDTARCVDLSGDYGYYDRIIDSAFMTGRALMREYRGGDTLYVHGRYVRSVRQLDSIFVPEDTVARIDAYTRIDTSYVTTVHPRVRFYRSDMQGICDSMQFTSVDSTLRMFVNPIIWNEDHQIFGRIVEVQFDDSTMRRAFLPDQAFAAQHIEGEHYNQMSGKTMTADFENGEMRRLLVDGNVEIIMYPEESDSTINKMVNAQSSFMECWFRGQSTERVKMWPETQGTVTPMFIARKSLFYLPKFKWYDGIRPTGPLDVFIIPEEMEKLMQEGTK